MTSRVTFSQINSLVQNNIMKNYAKLAKFQEQLSSGRRIQRPSDAPVDLTNDLQLRSDLSKLEQFKRNIEDGTSYLSVVETVASNTNDLFQHSRELAIQASNDTNTATDRSYILKEVRVVLDQLVSISNQTFKGQYLFAGTETQTQPYELRAGKDIINSIDDRLSAPDATDTFIDPLSPMPQTIQIWDRGVRDSELHQPNPNGHAKVIDIIPGSLTIQGFTEGTDYQVDYVNGKIVFLDTSTISIPANPGPPAFPGANMTPIQIASADPADPNLAGWPPMGDPLWGPPGSPSPQPGGGISIDYEWIRRSEKDMDGEIIREIEGGLISRINTTASEIFGSETEVSSWDAIIKLMEGLHENNSHTIRNSLSDINSSFDRSLSAQAMAGARTNRFDVTSSRNETIYIESTRLHSNLEDVDFAKTISDFLLQESVHSASLQSGARVIQPTLANFI